MTHLDNYYSKQRYLVLPKNEKRIFHHQNTLIIRIVGKVPLLVAKVQQLQKFHDIPENLHRNAR